MITINVVVTIPVGDFQNCKNFSILTKKNTDDYHQGYFQFTGETEEVAVKIALEKISKITGCEAAAEKIKCDDTLNLVYHLKFPSAKVVYKELVKKDPALGHEKITPLRKTGRSTVSPYQFIEREKLSLSSREADYTKNIYQTIHENLYEKPKQEVKANCGGVSGRSEDYDSATQGSQGYSFLCESNLLLKQVYYYFYSFYNRKKQNLESTPICPVILSQLPDSPNTRSPGGRKYRHFFGMGTAIYVLDETTGAESESVINLSLLIKTRENKNGNAKVSTAQASATTELLVNTQTKTSIPTTASLISPDHPNVAGDLLTKANYVNQTDLISSKNESSNETLEVMPPEKKETQDVNNTKSSKPSNTNVDANKERLRAFLKKEQEKAPLFYHQTHNIQLISTEDNEAISVSDDKSNDLSQTEDLIDEIDLIVSTENDDDILFSDDENDELSQDEDSKDEMGSTQQATLTKRKLINCKKEKEKAGKKRSPGQNETFNSSAKSAALACGLPSNLIYEWTHLIAHEFIGNAGQTKENLVMATRNCNTAMMHLELVIKKLILAGHTVNTKVSAQADNSTLIRTKYHCVKSISYLLIIDGKEINFNFDPYLEITPPKNLWRAMLASTVWELIKPLSDENNTDYNALDYDACKMDLNNLNAFLKNPPELPKIAEPPKASNEILTTPIRCFPREGADHSTFFNSGKRKRRSVESNINDDNTQDKRVESYIILKNVSEPHITEHPNKIFATIPFSSPELTDPIPIPTLTSC